MIQYDINRTKNQNERMDVVVKKRTRGSFMSQSKVVAITRIRDVLVVNYQPIIALDW